MALAQPAQIRRVVVEHEMPEDFAESGKPGERSQRCVVMNLDVAVGERKTAKAAQSCLNAIVVDGNVVADEFD